MRAEAALEESSRQLVVLLVRLIRGDGDGHHFQLRNVGHELGLPVLGIEFLERRDGVGEAVADAEADGFVRELAGGDEVVGVHGDGKCREISDQ